MMSFCVTMSRHHQGSCKRIITSLPALHQCQQQLRRQRLSLSRTVEKEETTNNNNKKKDRLPRRCLFSVPGADIRKIQKATTLNADSIVLDLEDGVSMNNKDEARQLVRDTLLDESISFGENNSSELAVRINALDTGNLVIQDLEAILPCPRLQAIVIPKVEYASNIHFVSTMIQALSPQPQKVQILAAIESAMGILNLRDIASSASTNTTRSNDKQQDQYLLDGLIFASEDYCTNIGAIRTKTAMELLYARLQLVTIAKAYNLQAIDMVHINFRNLNELTMECQIGHEFGFTGKQAIHPNQISIIQEYYSPSVSDIEYATKCIEAYEATVVNGKKGGGGAAAACVVNGIVVDLPVYKWAIQIINRANNNNNKATATDIPKK